MSLAAYLLLAMVAWIPPKLQPEGASAALARYTEIAADVAEVLERPDEPAIVAGDDAEKTRTGLLLLSMAKSEGAFWARVDRGECRPSECDGGRAWTLWQFHPASGLAFAGDGWRYCTDEDRAARACFLGPDFVADRRLAIRMVLHLLRGPHTAGWDGTERRRRAEDWIATHPR